MKLVETVDRVRSETRCPYRTLLRGSGLSYPTLVRWKERLAADQPLIKPPGPPKTVQMNLKAILVGVRALRHEQRRSFGTTALYKARRSEISRRGLQALVRAERTRVEAERRAKMRRIEWLVPGMAWAMDGTEIAGGVEVNNARDLGGRYKFEPWSAIKLRGIDAAEHLEQLIEKHGAPLFFKRDRGAYLRSWEVEQILQEHLIIPLDSPLHYPQFNGGIEHQQGEFKELLGQKYPHIEESLAAQTAVVMELNHRPQPCLGGRTPCAVLGEGKGAMRAFTRPKRKEIIGWIKRETVAILAGMQGSVTAKARDAAWRQAVETWLHRNGFITVTVNGKVLPPFP